MPETSTGLRTKKTHEVTIQNNLPGASTGLRTKTHEATFKQERKGIPTILLSNRTMDFLVTPNGI